MANPRPLCPILLIGFPAPKEGERDIRRCTEECALFDEDIKQCSIKSCMERLEVISGQIDDVMSLVGEGFIPFEDDETFDYDANNLGKA